MRLLCCLTFLVGMALNASAQMEPCLSGVDTPGCGIKITLDPPIEGNILTAPNQVTVDVPMRLHPTKVQLSSGPSGTQVADKFTLVAEAAHYKKVNGHARFTLELKSCPENGDAFIYYIYAPRLPYPLYVNSEAFQCKPRDGK